MSLTILQVETTYVFCNSNPKTPNTHTSTLQAPVLRHSDKARSEGFGITLHLDSRTRSEIDEFSTSGFIGVKKSSSPDKHEYTLIVPSATQIIDSITSDSICRIASDHFHWAVEKRPINYSELSSFTEVMAAGTAAALVPIRSITMRSTNDKIVFLEGEEPGPICLRLLKTLQGMQRGEVEDVFGWCERVEEPRGYGKVEVNRASSKAQNVHGEVGGAEFDQ